MSLNKDVVLALRWTRCDGEDCREGIHWMSPGQINHKMYAYRPDFMNDLVASDTLLETMRAEGLVVHESRYPDGFNLLAVVNPYTPIETEAFRTNGDSITENRCRAFLATRGD